MSASPNTVRRTGRWTGVGALAFGAAALGTALREPTVLLLAVVGVAYAAAARAASPPPVSLTLDRTLATTEPGESVRVTLDVTNTGERTLPDLRVVDGVPETLAVTDGSPRLGTTLPPGASDTLEYTVTARRGVHEFGATQLAVRDWTGAAVRETERTTETAFDCVPPLDALRGFPLRARTAADAGRLTSSGAGSGVEFHSTRQYRPSDPLSRIDWARVARTGDLTTVDFREERTAETVLLVDARESAYRADANNEPALEHAVGAAGTVAAALIEANVRVGLAALGPREEWVRPDVGRTHRVRLRERLARAPAFDPLPPTERFRPVSSFRRLRGRLPAGAQVVLFSPLLDDRAHAVARRLEAHGFAVTVVAPDVTDRETAARALARIDRRRRLSSLRGAGVRVVDWNPSDPLAAAVARARRGWDR